MLLLNYICLSPLHQNEMNKSQNIPRFAVVSRYARGNRGVRNVATFQHLFKKKNKLTIKFFLKSTHLFQVPFPANICLTHGAAQLNTQKDKTSSHDPIKHK